MIISSPLRSRTCKSLFLSMSMLLGMMSSFATYAGFIVTFDTVIETGTVFTPIVEKIAHIQIYEDGVLVIDEESTDRLRKEHKATPPPSKGRILIDADPASERISYARISDIPDPFNTGTKSRGWFEKRITGVEVTEVTTVRTDITVKKVDQIVDGYLSQNYIGSLIFFIELDELTTGTNIFDSQTTFTNTSSDVIIDSTEVLNWERVPGYFGGLGSPDSDLGGLINEHSTNRWLLKDFSKQFSFTSVLNPGDALDQVFKFSLSSSSSSSGSTGFSGISDVPEPTTFLLILSGILGIYFGKGKHLNSGIPVTIVSGS